MWVGTVFWLKILVKYNANDVKMWDHSWRIIKIEFQTEGREINFNAAMKSGLSPVSLTHPPVRGSLLLNFIFIIHYNWGCRPPFGWICCTGNGRRIISHTGTISTSSGSCATSCGWHQLVQCRFTSSSNLKWCCYQTWCNLLPCHLNISTREWLEFCIFTLEKESMEEWPLAYTKTSVLTDVSIKIFITKISINSNQH